MKETQNPADTQGFDAQPLSVPHRVATLSSRKPTRFELKPDAGVRRLLATYLGILSVKALKFRGEITPLGRRDFTLKAELTAVIEQACSVSLVPVKAEISESVTRSFVDGLEMPDADEAEMPDDETIEALGEIIDVGHIATEALMLALPLYPRAPNAVLETASFTAPGQTALQDADLRPFAGLAGLKAKLAQDDSKDDDAGLTGAQKPPKDNEA